MMKVVTLLTCLLATLLLSCNSASDNSTPEAGSSDIPTIPEVPQWVTYKGQSGPGIGKKIVLVSGDEEYRSEEALPQLGRILSRFHGFDCTVLFAQDPENKGVIDPNYLHNIPGLESLQPADLMILFTRFRALPDDQMQYIDRYLMEGKPVLAIRTATHAFNIQDSTSRYHHYGNYYEGDKKEWNGGFGRLVLGERWYTHHGHHKHQSTRGIIAPGAGDHPIVRGLKDGEVWGPTDVYGVRLPLPGDARPILLGQTINRAGEYDEKDPFYGMKPSDSEVATVNPASKEKYDPNKPMMPIAWTKTYQLPGGKAGTAFTSTIGASTDLMSEGTRRLLVNATYYLLGMEVPQKAKVDIVGNYRPSAYSFHDDAYWDRRNMKVADHIE